MKIILEKEFEIIEKMNLLDKPTIKKAEYKVVQSWFIGSLYVADPIDHPPVRVDYAPMDIIQKNIYDKIEANSPEEKTNYLVLDGQKPLQFLAGTCSLITICLSRVIVMFLPVDLNIVGMALVSPFSVKGLNILLSNRVLSSVNLL